MRKGPKGSILRFRSLARYKLPYSTKRTIYSSANVFSTKVSIEDTIFTSPTGADGTAILRGHPSHAKV